jgi:ABC-type sugar transport system substrate-binding protein
MKTQSRFLPRFSLGVTALLAACFGTAVLAAPPKVVTGPNSDPKCFTPWAADTKLFQYPAKKGPYRIALANGYIANTWRIQMIKTAKAYAEQKEVATKLKEYKVVSTGEDVAAQIAAINNFIDSGFDAIVVNAQNPAAFKPVIKRANDAGVVLVAFDNILDTDEAINVNVDQKGLGKYWADWLVKNVPAGGKVLEVRGVSGTSVDRDRHDGIQEVLKASGKKWETIEVIGKWDDPTAQKVTADAIAVHKKFDAITAQGGDTGVVQAMLDAKHLRAVRRRDRERFSQVLCEIRESRPEVRLRRHGSGAGRGGDQGGDCSTGRQGGAPVGQAAAVHRGEPGVQGRRQLLFRAIRQLLRRQRLPDLRHQLHCPGDHGPERGEQVMMRESRSRNA